LASERFFAVRGPESTYGDGATGSSWEKIRVTGMGDPVNRNATFEEACDISVPTYAAGGVYKVSGTVDALFRFSSFAPLLESILGSTNGVFSDTPKSFAFCIGDDQAGTQTMYYGCGISSMELNFSVKEFVKAKMTWIGQKGVITTGVSPTWVADPTTDLPAVFYNAIVKVGGTPIRAKNVTLKIDRKFDEDYHYIGSPLLQGLYMNGMTELGGTLTLGGGQWTELLNVITGGEATEITANMLTTAAGTENLNELKVGTLVIELHDLNGNALGTITAGNIVFTEMNRTVQGRNQWDKTVNFKVVLPTNDSFSIVGA
jgi:hypothetical protein